MVTHAYNPSKEEAGGLKVLNNPQLHSKIEAKYNSVLRTQNKYNTIQVKDFLLLPDSLHPCPGL